MSKVIMRAPANFGGFTMGNSIYAPSADGMMEIEQDHVEQARSHGLEIADANWSEPTVALASDPNVQRAGGSQPVVRPGGDVTAVEVVLTTQETEQAIADATATKGELLTDDEKAAALAGAKEAKKAATDAAAAEPADDKPAKAK